MRLNTAPESPVTMGGVSHVSEFKIRNSAKAFSILSSGLYANKIRAIIRELSCNAVDSHVAAGVPDLPFDLHLPSSLAPHFAIRDYGTGLSHDQVLNIYTTYFESTKTDSNDFIGALGLGSKSPFSYTDNFTVTAIQNGKKGIYSAYINDQGVPSVALMMTEDTDEANGVEVRFAVDTRNDFYKFSEECETIFTHFRVKPNFVNTKVNIFTPTYDTMDVVPGVHVRKSRYRDDNVAVMGHIEYPIDIPNLPSKYSHIDNMGLEIHFQIGDIDFQASREGLQYTKETIKAITDKYDQVMAVLDKVLEDEANKIDHLWDRRDFLIDRNRQHAWQTSTVNYIKKTKFPMLDVNNWGGGIYIVNPEISAKTLRETYNIEVRAFTVTYGEKCSDFNTNSQNEWSFRLGEPIYFVLNPDNEKIINRAKYHFRNNGVYGDVVYILNRVDTTKPADYDGFAALLFNPREKHYIKVEDLAKPERNKKDKSEKINVMMLKKPGYQQDLTWFAFTEDLSKLDASKTYYYLSMKGYVTSTQEGKEVDAKRLFQYLLETNIPEFADMRLYGVRKGDLETVKALSNWKPIEVAIPDVVATMTPEKLASGFIKRLDYYGKYVYNKQVAAVVGPDSDYSKLVNSFDGSDYNMPSLQKACSMLSIPESLMDVSNQAKEIYQRVSKKYPLLEKLRVADDGDAALIDYIKLVDTYKEVN
jgi:hypothetical protein